MKPNPEKAAAPVAPPEAFLLTSVAGCVDAVGFVTFAGLFVAHMSGNSAALGAWFGQGFWEKGAPHLLAIPVFLLGLIGGYLFMHGHPTRKRCAILLLTEAALLSAFGIFRALLGSPEFLSPAYFLMATLLLLAMGLQNSTLREAGRSGFPSTYVTGILDTFAHAVAGLLATRMKGAPSGQNAPLAARAGGLWLCYALGATAGSAGLLLLGPLVLVAPVALLLAVVGVQLRAP